MSEFYKNFTHWGCSSVKSQSSLLHMIMKFYLCTASAELTKKKLNQIQSNISRRCLTYKYLLDIKNVCVKLPVPQQCGFNQIRLSLSFDVVSLVCCSEELPMCIVQKKTYWVCQLSASVLYFPDHTCSEVLDKKENVLLQFFACFWKQFLRCEHLKADWSALCCEEQTLKSEAAEDEQKISVMCVCVEISI